MPVFNQPASLRGAPFMELQAVSAGYGSARVLHEVDLQLFSGETLVVIGRNGVGKTTLVETIVGLTNLHAGVVLLDGAPIQKWAAYKRNRAGIAWVPQQREIFPSLRVEENLSVVARPGAWSADRVYDLFPRLRERRKSYADQLSGGEQQMLAFGRALMTNPRLLLLDEPMEGLAPIIVTEMFDAIGRMREESDMAILLVEQKYELALEKSDRCLVLDHGAVVHAEKSADLLRNEALINRLMGFGH